jgi:hypothetical protein
MSNHTRIQQVTKKERKIHYPTQPPFLQINEAELLRGPSHNV